MMSEIRQTVEEWLNMRRVDIMLKKRISPFELKLLISSLEKAQEEKVKALRKLVPPKCTPIIDKIFKDSEGEG